MNIIKKVIIKIKRKIYILIFKLFKIKNNKIVFVSYDMNRYACNPKYISEYILENAPSKFEIVWIFKNPKKISRINYLRQNGIKCIKYGTIKYYYHMVTCKFVIENNRVNFFVDKKKDQIYIQTWHALTGIKKAELDIEKYLSKFYIETAKKDGKKVKYLISGTERMDEYYKKFFYLNGELLRIGNPRNDLFYKNDIELKSRIRKEIGLDDDTKILLYMPTFRDGKDIIYNLNYEKVCESLVKKFGGKWIVLVRLHPNIANTSKHVNDEYSIDASKYEESQELIYISDIVISDYSSSIFDALVAGKIGFLYQQDYQEFINDGRGVTIKREEMPFSVAENEIELYDIISKFDMNKYLKEVEKFKKWEGIYEDGHACEKMLDLIYKESKIEN